MLLKELFPHIIVLALDRRFDTHVLPLYNHIKERFGITINIFLAGDGKHIKDRLYNHIDIPQAAPRLPNSSGYPTWYRPSAYNAFLCHQKMIDMATRLGWNRVLMLEDDMFFEAHTEELLDKLDNEIKATAWDMLYVGFCAPPHRTDINREDGPFAIQPAGQCCGGFHCVGIHSRIYNKILSFQPLACMDVMCDDLPNRYALVPKCGEQKPGWSYVEQTIFTRPDCQAKLDKVRKRWPNA
jgi:hypothetical protein